YLSNVALAVSVVLLFIFCVVYGVWGEALRRSCVRRAAVRGATLSPTFKLCQAPLQRLQVLLQALGTAFGCPDAARVGLQLLKLFTPDTYLISVSIIIVLRLDDCIICTLALGIACVFRGAR